MFSYDRRRFLSQALHAGAAWGATSLFGGGPFLSGQTLPGTSDIARVYVDSRRLIGALDRNLFGSFLEHLGRAIYEGVYDPVSKLSDANGFRKDVMEEVRQMGVPIIRYRSEEHTSELQSPYDLVCRLLLEKKKPIQTRLTRD